MTRLNPLLPSWLSGLSQSARNRGPLLRRSVAAALAVTGVAILLRGTPQTAMVTVLAARGDLRPGILLEAGNVRELRFPADAAPAGAISELSAVVGHTLASPARDGEALTDARLLSPRLAGAVTGSADARIVPIRLADNGVAELLRPGDRVDVVTTVEKPGVTAKPDTPRLLAPAAIVVLVTPAAAGARGTSDRIVMLALPAQHAASVAGSSLTRALTVLLR